MVRNGTTKTNSYRVVRMFSLDSGNLGNVPDLTIPEKTDKLPQAGPAPLEDSFTISGKLPSSNAIWDNLRTGIQVCLPGDAATLCEPRRAASRLAQVVLAAVSLL